MAGELEERPPPWNWKRYGFNYWHMLIDGTTKRFNDNTKIIVVDGQTVITSTRRHRYEHWRETDKGNMLDLRDDRGFKMATALNNYFIHNT